jgi:hypothetical protein
MTQNPISRNELPPIDQPFFGVLNHNPIFTNQMNVLFTNGMIFIDFRTIAPIIFAPTDTKDLQIDLRQIPPHTRMVMTEENALNLFNSLKEVLGDKVKG